MTYAKYDDERIKAAMRIWLKLNKQLPKFGLTEKQKGAITKAAVLRCMVYRMGTRQVLSRTMRRMQHLMNSIARGCTQLRFRTMKSDEVTTADLRERIGHDPIWITIGEDQIKHLGHLA